MIAGGSAAVWVAPKNWWVPYTPTWTLGTLAKWGLPEKNQIPVLNAILSRSPLLEVALPTKGNNQPAAPEFQIIESYSGSGIFGSTVTLGALTMGSTTGTAVRLDGKGRQQVIVFTESGRSKYPGRHALIVPWAAQAVTAEGHFLLQMYGPGLVVGPDRKVQGFRLSFFLSDAHSAGPDHGAILMMARVNITLAEDGKTFVPSKVDWYILPPDKLPRAPELDAWYEWLFGL